jgi:hypothetical protein
LLRKAESEVASREAHARDQEKQAEGYGRRIDELEGIVSGLESVAVQLFARLESAEHSAAGVVSGEIVAREAAEYRRAVGECEVEVASKRTQLQRFVKTASDAHWAVTLSVGNKRQKGWSKQKKRVSTTLAILLGRRAFSERRVSRG